MEVEIILSDTIRVSTDEKLINRARAAVAHHGAANVKVVTTKIDVSTIRLESRRILTRLVNIKQRVGKVRWTPLQPHQ